MQGEESFCLLVEEAKEQGVIDSACSRTVALVKWIKKFNNRLEGADKKRVWTEESGASFQFGGGEKQKSILRLGLPCMIGDTKGTLITIIVSTKIPLPIGINLLEKSKAILDFGKRVATLFE